jgi:hypothetical protein
MAIDFDVTRDEQVLILAIVKRAKRMDLIRAKPLDLDMDLCATHRNGNPLRLKALLDADDFNFAHDVCGIQQNIDRETGEMMNCFLPRFTDSAALPENRSADQGAA